MNSDGEKAISDVGPLFVFKLHILSCMHTLLIYYVSNNELYTLFFIIITYSKDEINSIFCSVLFCSESLFNQIYTVETEPIE